MWRSIAACLIALRFLKFASSLECILCDEKSCDNKCIGDYCKAWNMTSGSFTTIAKGCYTGDLGGPGKPGCYRSIDESDNDRVECYCNSGPRCNNDTLIQNSKAIDIGPIECELVHGGEKDTENAKGSYCYMGVDIIDGTKIISKGSAAAFSSLPGIELKPEAPPVCLSMTTTLEKHEGTIIMIQCCCATAMCNKDETPLKQLPSSSPKQVTCYQQECVAPGDCTDFETCLGDYCYARKEAIKYDGSKEHTMLGCLNASIPLRLKPELIDEEGYIFEGGDRDYSKRTYRICAQDYCIVKASGAKQFVKSTESPSTQASNPQTATPSRKIEEQPATAAPQRTKGPSENQGKNAASATRLKLLAMQLLIALAVLRLWM